jgi:hypothetical protein
MATRKKPYKYTKARRAAVKRMHAANRKAARSGGTRGRARSAKGRHAVYTAVVYNPEGKVVSKTTLHRAGVTLGRQSGRKRSRKKR